MKESKDAVEKYWVSNRHSDYIVPKTSSEPATLGDILERAAKRDPIGKVNDY